MISCKLDFRNLYYCHFKMSKQSFSIVVTAFLISSLYSQQFWRNPVWITKWYGYNRISGKLSISGHSSMGKFLIIFTWTILRISKIIDVFFLNTLYQTAFPIEIPLWTLQHNCTARNYLEAYLESLLKMTAKTKAARFQITMLLLFTAFVKYVVYWLR